MAIETLGDIIEQVADWIGVYGAHTDGEKIDCRICFTINLRQRIEAACNIEALMRRVEIKDHEYMSKTTHLTDAEKRAGADGK
jgi:hypothetical protein